MVGRSADKGQTQADIHAGVESDDFESDQALVVIEGHGDLVWLIQDLPENDVGRVGTADLQSFLPGQPDGGRDLVRFLMSQQSILAGMGIQARDQEFKMSRPDLFNAAVKDGEKSAEVFPGDPPNGLLQR